MIDKSIEGSIGNNYSHGVSIRLTLAHGTKAVKRAGCVGSTPGSNDGRKTQRKYCTAQHSTNKWKRTKERSSEVEVRRI